MSSNSQVKYELFSAQNLSFYAGFFCAVIQEHFKCKAAYFSFRLAVRETGVVGQETVQRTRDAEKLEDGTVGRENGNQWRNVNVRVKDDITIGIKQGLLVLIKNLFFFCKNRLKLEFFRTISSIHTELINFRLAGIGFASEGNEMHLRDQAPYVFAQMLAQDAVADKPKG